MDGSKDRRLVLNSLLKESWAGWACKRVIGRQIFPFFLAPLTSMILITLQGGSTSFHEKAERSSMRHPDDCITWLRWEARDCRGFSKIWGDEKAVHRRSHRDKSRNAAHLQLVAGTRQLTSTWASSSPSNLNNKLYSRLLRAERDHVHWARTKRSEWSGEITIQIHWVFVDSQVVPALTHWSDLWTATATESQLQYLLDLSGPDYSRAADQYTFGSLPSQGSICQPPT